ncbi:MAG TPA: calcium-binding protein [Tepidisphaeraceae bacterium]|jgi:hypothetical protein
MSKRIAKAGRLSQSDSTKIEALEGRRLLAGQPFGSVVDGILLVNGTASNDQISFRTKGLRTLVRMNDVLAKFTTSSFSGIEVQAGDGKDAVDFSAMSVPCYVNLGTGNDVAYGGTGNDSLTGAAGKDTLYGNAGNDRLNGGNTGDVLFGGEGNDVVYAGFGDDVAEGGSGRNRLFGEDGVDKLYGGRQSDGIYGGAGSDRLYGMAGNDVLSGESGKDRLYGMDGNDQLLGGSGADWMYGDAGDDTIDSKDGGADNLVDGGEGADVVVTDTNLETPAGAETVNGSVDPTDPPTEPVTPPVVPVGGDLARAVSFSDEALWDANFADAAAKAKAMGIKAVRVWFETGTYDERPHAYDDVQEADIVKNWDEDTSAADREITAGLAMRRAFDLKAMGFQVMLTVSVNGGDVPTSAQQVKDFYTYLLNSPKTAGGSSKLKDAVDFWEVGQEVDLARNWLPSGVNKTSGLKAYVNQVLIPAASVLHSGPASNWEKVISASVTFSPIDLNTILTEAKAQGQINALDYAGYHPYGRYDPEQNNDALKSRVADAVAVAKKFNKPLGATEWNVRGYPTDGSRDTQWANAIKDVYKKYIAPNFGLAVYYAFTDNFAPRGGLGNVTARPAGVFAHDTSANVTPNSPVADLIAYYESPLVPNQPFYDAVKSFYA